MTLFLSSHHVRRVLVPYRNIESYARRQNVSASIETRDDDQQRTLSVRGFFGVGMCIDVGPWCLPTGVVRRQAFLEQGTRNRRTAATNMNIESSRSHAVFTLEFKQSTARHSMGGSTPVSRNLPRTAEIPPKKMIRTVGGHMTHARILCEIPSSPKRVSSCLIPFYSTVPDALLLA